MCYSLSFPILGLRNFTTALLSPVSFLLSPVFWLMSIVYFLLSSFYCLPNTVYCLLSIDYYSTKLGLIASKNPSSSYLCFSQ